MTTALYPGRFQPPHLGHIVTAVRLHDDYDKIIIAVTEAKPNFIQPEKVKEILQEVFKHFPKYEVIIIRGKEWMDNIPDGIDVVITGNDNSIKRLKKRNIKYRKIRRAEGIGYRGTDLRKLAGIKC